MVEALRVEQQSIAAADHGSVQLGDVTHDESGRDVGRAGPLASEFHGLGDDVDSDGIPAAVGQFDGESASAAADVECHCAGLDAVILDLLQQATELHQLRFGVLSHGWNPSP